jgi:hypothetical protein
VRTCQCSPQIARPTGCLAALARMVVRDDAICSVLGTFVCVSGYSFKVCVCGIRGLLWFGDSHSTSIVISVLDRDLENDKVQTLTICPSEIIRNC